MGISSALSASVSGLSAFSTSLSAISDNIANSQTVGYKRASTDFSALVTAQSGKGSYTAGGVDASVKSHVSEQGEIQRTGSATNLAISGDGFFVVSTGAGDGNAAGNFLYTRAGQFTPDAEGYLRNTSDQVLRGWPVAADGTVNANASDLDQLVPVNIANIGGAAEPTTQLTLDGNLRASQTVSAAEATYDPTVSANNLSSGAVDPDFEQTVQVFDSLGAARTVTFSFLKSSAAPNQWHVEAHVTPASDVANGGGLTDGQIATGVVSFTSNGVYDAANSTFPSSVSIGASGAGGNAAWAPNLGLAGQDIALDLGGATRPGGLTQYENASTLTSSANGSLFGSLSSVEVDDKGFVNAIFSNGVTRPVFQIPLATFLNADGLQKVAGGAYQSTTDSGAFTLRQPGTGAGAVEGAALESSTVDISKEFTDLIVTQRAYSANARIITTADQMLQELIQLRG